MAYNGAFECAKCPRSNDEQAPLACPMWWEISERHSLTAEVRVTKGCGYAMLPKFLVDTAKHTYQVHEAVVVARNEILDKVEVGNATAVFTGRLLSSAVNEHRYLEPGSTVSPVVPVAELDQSVRAVAIEHTEQQSGA